MMIEEEFSSDSNDEDYIPQGVSASEEEESGEDEGDLLNNQDDQNVEEKMPKNNKKLKRKSKTKISARKKVRKDEKFCELGSNFSEEEGKSLDAPSKGKTDLLWENFLKDTSTVRPSPQPNISKVKVVKEYNFAGETIKVENEIDINSKELKCCNISPTPNPKVISADGKNKPNKTNNPVGVVSSNNNVSLIPTKLLPMPSAQSSNRVGGGLSSVLNKISKKPRINILEKSKLDWQAFTKEEGIQEDLKKHNIGKQGYLERMSFLQRTDQKQFEMERDFRLANRKAS